MSTEDRLETKRTVFKSLLDEKKKAFARISQYQQEILQSVNEADLDKSEMIESQTENMMREMRIENESLDHLKQEIEKLESYDSLAIFDYVAPGTVILTNDKNYVVFSPQQEFTAHGKTFYGISTDSPIYEVLKDHEAGETLTFNDSKFVIEEVM